MAKQVVFEQEQAHNTRSRRTANTRKHATTLERLILRTGLTQNAHDVRRLFIVLIALAVAGTLYVWIQGGSTSSSYGNYDSFREAHPELAQ